MADNNNSLSSILAENWKISTAGPDSSDQSVIDYNINQLATKEAQLRNTTDPSERATIQAEVQQIKILLENRKKQKSTPESDNASMFDRSAKLDYARYPTYIAWEDNKRTSDEYNRSFQTNVPSMNKTMPVSQKSVQGEDGLSVKHLVQWSEAYPALRLRYQDFAYCKNVGLPNNRMVVLRRFRNGVPDNLFDHFRTSELQEYGYPVSTMITWVKPTENFISLSFSENWKTVEGDITSAFNLSSSSKAPGAKDGLFNVGSYNLLDSSLLFGLLSSIGGESTKTESLVDNFMNEPGGNPRLVRAASQRKVGGEGLSSSIEFKLDFEFEMRDIRNIDPGIAMLDLIGNCFRMGTEVSQFRLDYSLLKNDMITKILNNDFDVNLEQMLVKLGDITEIASTEFNKALSSITNIVKNANFGTFTDKVVSYITSDKAKEDGSKAATASARNIISRYRENIRHAIASETGLPSGRYHVTIGNPKQPIISCGDLVISTSRLTLGKDLAFNDFPKSFKYEISLESARERGRNELERIFNAGRGRLYVYKKPSDNPDYQLGKSTQF